MEAAVFGVVGIAWLAGREGAFGGSLLDFVCLSTVFYASLLSLVCGVFLHRGRVQCAYLGVVGGVWHLYLYGVITGEVVQTFFATGNATGCVANSDPRALVRTAFFGGTPMHQIPSGFTLALLTVDLLIAASAVGDQLWRLCAWSDVAVLAVVALHGSLSVRAGMVPPPGMWDPAVFWGLASVHVVLLVFDAVWQRAIVGARAQVEALRMWVHLGWILVVWLEFVTVWTSANSQGLFGWGLVLLFLKAIAHRVVVVAAEVRAISAPEKAEKAPAAEGSTPAADPDTAPSAPRAASITIPSAAKAAAAPAPFPAGMAPGVKTLFSVVRFPLVRDKKRS